MTMLVNLLVREHLDKFLDHYYKLTPDDRHNRFFSTMGPSAIRDWVMATTERPYSHYFFVKENEAGSSKVWLPWVLSPDTRLIWQSVFCHKQEDKV